MRGHQKNASSDGISNNANIRQRSNIQKIQFSQESMLPAPFFIMHQKAILPN